MVIKHIKTNNHLPVEDRNISPSLVLAYLMLRPSKAFCTVNVTKLTYFKACELASEKEFFQWHWTISRLLQKIFCFLSFKKMSILFIIHLCFESLN